LLRIYRFLASRKTALVLLVLVTVLSVAGALLPQEHLVGKRAYEEWKAANPALAALSGFLGLNRYASSWLFLAPLFLLLASTMACSLERIVGHFRDRPSRWVDGADLRNLEGRACYTLLHGAGPAGQAVEVVERVLRRARYAVDVQPLGDRRYLVSGEKGRWGFWGSIIFHLSFMLIFVGALLSAAGSLRGTMHIVEGQAFVEDHGYYDRVMEGPLFWESHRRFAVVLKDYWPVEKGEYVVDYRATLEVFDDFHSVKEDTVGIGERFVYEGVHFSHKSHGYAVKVKLMKQGSGEVLLDGYLSLAVLFEEDEVSYTDYYEVEEAGLRLDMHLYPDFASGEGGFTTASPFANNPYLNLAVTGIEGGESRLFQGLVKLGQTVRFGEYVLSFTDVRYWASFYVIYDRGIPVIFFGFWVGFFGLLWRVLVHRENLWILVEGGDNRVRVEAAGRSEAPKPLFQEVFDRVVLDIKKEVAMK